MVDPRLTRRQDAVSLNPPLSLPLSHRVEDSRKSRWAVKRVVYADVVDYINMYRYIDHSRSWMIVVRRGRGMACDWAISCRSSIAPTPRRAAESSRLGKVRPIRGSKSPVPEGGRNDIRTRSTSSRPDAPSKASYCAFVAHMTIHLLSSLSFLTLSATRAASVKASLTPRFRMAEHSRYRKAFILRATSRP